MCDFWFWKEWKENEISKLLTAFINQLNWLVISTSSGHEYFCIFGYQNVSKQRRNMKKNIHVIHSMSICKNAYEYPFKINILYIFRWH